MFKCFVSYYLIFCVCQLKYLFYNLIFCTLFGVKIRKYILLRFLQCIITIGYNLTFTLYISNNHYGHFAGNWKRKQTFLLLVKFFSVWKYFKTFGKSINKIYVQNKIVCKGKVLKNILPHWIYLWVFQEKWINQILSNFLLEFHQCIWQVFIVWSMTG